MTDYISYTLSRDFPDKICICPICSEYLDMEVTNSTKALRKIFSATKDCYYFSRLYKCGTCHWWCIRERFEVIDLAMVNLLILSPIIQKEPSSHLYKPNTTIAETEAWAKAIEDEQAYDNLQKLPIDLESILISCA